MIKYTLGGALGLFALPIVLQVAGSLGPMPQNSLSQTLKHLAGDPATTPRQADPAHARPRDDADQARGRHQRLGVPRHARDAAPRTVHRRGATHVLEEKAKAAVILIRLDPNLIKVQKARDWGVDGVVAYSKICTHVGCAVGLYEQQTHHLLCPCHQSTFDVTRGLHRHLRPGQARAAAAARSQSTTRATSSPRKPFDRSGRTELLGAWLMSTAPARPADAPARRRPSRRGAALGRAQAPRRRRRLGRRPHRRGQAGRLPHEEGLPGPLVVHARRDRDVLDDRLPAHRRVPHVLVRPERRATRLRRLLRAAARASAMSEAYASTLNISFDIKGGLHHPPDPPLGRPDVHRRALVVHMFRVFFTGAFRKPREINWVIGTVLALLAIIEGFAGYSLPDDLLSGTGIRAMARLRPDRPGHRLLPRPTPSSAAPFPGEMIIPRLYSVHILLVPAILIGLFTAHIGLVFVQKHTQYPGPGPHQQQRRRLPGDAGRTPPRPAASSSSSSASSR